MALIVGGYLPPPAANDTAEELAAFYREDTDRIRVGVFIGLLATAGWGALVAVTAVQLRRAEDDRPVMAWLQAVSGAVTYVALLMCFTLLALASFRPEREPESTQLLHDLGWFCLLFTVVAPATQAISTGIGILADTRTDPVFPRWLGYLGVWAGVLFVPGVALSSSRPARSPTTGSCRGGSRCSRSEAGWSRSPGAAGAPRCAMRNRSHRSSLPP